MEIELSETFLEAKIPDQNSPEHILNVFNDDCIKEILGRLENRRDFFNAASVCKRFQYVAQTWFSHKTLQIGNKNRKSAICSRTSTFIINDSSTTILDDLYGYLSIFGNCIRTIEWYSPRSTIESISAEIFKMIAKFCGKTLIRLVIIGRVEIILTPQFEVLKRFEFHYGILVRFEPPHSLKYLRLTQLNINSYSRIHLDCLERNFPKLVEAHFGDFSNVMPTTKWFGSFLKQNPQLVKLTLIANEYFTPRAEWSHAIRLYATNLESLHLDLFSMDMKDLSGLTKLKCLRIPYGYLGKKQIDKLVALNLPIEELETSLKSKDIYVAQRISKLKRIKTLNLNNRFVTSSLIENLPPLDHLNIRGVDISKVHVR